MENGEEFPLSEALLLLQSVVVSCLDRKDFPYSRSQANVFTALAMEGEMTMKRLSRFLGCQQEQATRVLAPLADDGYVERRTDPTNRTRVHVRLTAAGEDFLREYRVRLAAKLREKLESALDGEETASLFRSANTLVRTLRKVKETEN